ncbi:hypothetical protein RFI_12703 [Reticulomyxa filosa]|uniref:Uncharacterized protein n=1 Tax=Reticulomyxa filosa TaxID=46433 RepID=X6NDR3_RETFI|nr:hypothetical protein RFI_12703 [Reticulomyxa filosa]|eukprot:ETO24455.1 hypothetical protein RFI_12703 [Reticulomyxa filosa]
MGGGTIDAACLTILGNGTMAETHHRETLCIGGMVVDQEFENLLSRIFEGNVIREFKEKFKNQTLLRFALEKQNKTKQNKKRNPRVWLLQQNEFWRAKHSLPEEGSWPKDKHWNMKLTMAFKNYLKKTLGSLAAVKKKFQTFSEINNKSKLEKNKTTKKKKKYIGTHTHSNFLLMDEDLLELSYETWLFLHKKLLAAVQDFVSKLLEFERVKPKVLVLTGGFSNCPFIVPMLQELLRKREKCPKIYQTHNPHEAVVRGSVLWATNKDDLPSTRIPSTLGLSVDKIWYPGDPNDDHKVSSFESFTGYIRKKCFKPIILLDEEFKDEFELYKSKDKDEIQYCNDKRCKLLKKFILRFENPFEKQTNLDIIFILKRDQVELLYENPDMVSQSVYVKFEGEDVNDVIKLDVETKQDV